LDQTHHQETTMQTTTTRFKPWGLALVIGFCTLLPAAQAQTITGITVSPSVQVGQPAQVTVTFDVPNTVYCGLRLDWGDNTGADVPIDDAKLVPYTTSHAYSAPGDYRVTAEGRKVMSRLNCLGKQIGASVKVLPKPAAAEPVAAGLVKPAPLCADGWKLDAKGQNKKTKAFTCTAKAGTALPAVKTTCPGDLTYFENVKKGQLGCRP
jgi:hypothetical protein